MSQSGTLIDFGVILNGNDSVEDMSECGSRRVAVSAENRLQERLVLANRRIACEFHEGTLVLRGQVSSFYEKQLAQEAVRTLDGVEQIVNRLEVVTTTLTFVPPTCPHSVLASAFSR